MMNDGNSKTIPNLCKSHSNRSERDLYRLCTSKLNKSELEDLYFTLLDTNVQLKKTINGQHEQIKLLSTKVQRLTAQKPISGNRNCCINSKAVLNEQKGTIADLKKINERLSERLRILNMRLCSAKQFLKRPQSTSRCTKCCLTSNTSFKNLSMSALYTKRSEANLQIETGSYRHLDKESSHPKLLEFVSTQTENLPVDDTCQQNKCRHTIDNLNLKIENLEEELATINLQYKNKICELNEEVTSQKLATVRMRSEYSEIEHKIQSRAEDCKELGEKLRKSEALCDELSAQLMIERSKVSELEMRIRADDVSSKVVKALEKKMKSSFIIVPNTSSTPIINTSVSKTTKDTDDSGYTDNSRSQNDSNVLEQIANLHQELNSLKLSMKNDQQEGKYGLTFENSTKSLSKTFITTEPTSDDKNTSNLLTNDDQISMSQLQDTLQIPVASKRSKIPHFVKNVIQTLKENKSSSNVNNNTDDKIIKYENEQPEVNINEKDITNDRSYNNNISRIDNEQTNAIDITIKSNSITIEDGKSKENDTIKTDSDKSKKEFIQNSNSEAIGEKFTKNIKHITKIGSKDKIKVNDYVTTNEVDTNLSVNEVNGENVGRKKAESARNKFIRGISYVIENKPKKKYTKYASVDSADNGQRTYSLKHPVATSSPNYGTYVISNTTSSNNTDCEISSLTDLPSEDKSPFDYISPGEERPVTVNDSYTTTTDYGSLSEGELPLTEVRRLSFAEVDITKTGVTDSFCDKSSDIDEALRAIASEMNRCRLLMDEGEFTIPTHH